VSGTDLYNELARARPGDERKIVFMSGAAPVGAGKSGLDAARILEKPLDAALLISALHAAADAGKR